MGVSRVKTPCNNKVMNSLVKIKFSRKIKELRRNQGITQEQLAELIETSYKYLQRIEGKTPPNVRLTTIIKLAKALKVKPSKLLEF